jgi:hypothetical protein
MADNGNWHNSARDLIGHWIMKGRSNREMLLYATAFTRPGYTIEQTEEEIQKCIESFRIKYDARIPRAECRGADKRVQINC